MNTKSAATYGLFTEKPKLNQPPISRRHIGRWIATLAPLGALAWLLGPAVDVAQAHATLIGTSPGQGSTLRVAPRQVVLEFDESVQTNFAVVDVVGPDGVALSSGDVSVTDNTVIARVRPPTVAGDFTVAWRVVSDDGHPVDGQFSYTLTKRALSHVRPSSEPAVVAAAHSSPNRSWLTSGTGQLAIGVGVALVAFVLFRFRRRRSR